MQKRFVLLVLMIAALLGCASEKDTATSATDSQPPAEIKKNNVSRKEEPTTGNREVQDSQIMDVSKIDTTEQVGWMDPKNPPELKRQFHVGDSSVVLPEDMYPVKTLYKSAGLFKFQNRDAYMYIFSPRGIDSNAFLDINLNTLDLRQAKGYHEMVIDLRGNTLQMAFMLDATIDGYIRYVEIKKAYQPAEMLVSALLVKEPQSHADLQYEYKAVLATLKHDPN